MAGTRKKAKKSRDTELTSWLTRRQVAVLLGLTDAQVEAMHGRELHPRQSVDRSWRYPPAAVAGLLAGGTADGVVSAKVFALFKQGVGLADVVIETQQTPNRVTELRAQYDRMAGGIFLPPAAVEVARRELGADAVSSGDALVSRLGAALEARYQAGFREGREDAQDFGEVVDSRTGERRRVLRGSP